MAADATPAGFRPSPGASRLFLALVGVTLVMMMLTSFEGAFYRAQRGDPLDWPGLVMMRALDWGACALFVPPLYALIDRLLRRRTGPLMTAAALLPASLAAACGKFVVHEPLAALVDPLNARTIGAAIHAELLAELMFYWAVMAGLYLFLHGRRKAHDQAPDTPLSPGWGSADGRLLVRERSGVQVIAVADILWVEAQGNYSAVHVRGRRRLIRQTMRALEQDLPPGRFVRVHRSAIVNVDQAERVEPTGTAFRVILKDGSSAPVSRASVNRLRSRIQSAGFPTGAAAPQPSSRA